MQKLSGRIRIKKRLYLLISGTFLLSFPHTALCQSTPKPIQMGLVLSDSIRISGNFGELRSNHFHSGIDFKTGEKEGKPVYAAAEGYISRIKVSSNGYGKVLYITHPNDIVTVYGHLRIFYRVMEDTIKKRQTDTREYEMELFPDSTAFPIKKGDLIGYSGNSGSSAGPHLHFETRNQFSEKPFNPEIAGYLIEDTIPPLIKAIAIYNPGPFGGLYGSSKQMIECRQTDISGPIDTISTTGNDFFVGFETIELAGVEPNQLGIRSVKLYLNDSLVFNARIDSFSFEETRMINAMIDYPFYAETGRKLVLCHSLKGNRLSFLANQYGMLKLNEFGIHKLKLRIEDTSGNFAERWLYVRKTGDVIVPFIQKEGVIYQYGKPVKINTINSTVDISPFSFYEVLRLEVTERNPQIQNTALHSPVINVGPAGIPVHDPVTISIKPEQSSSDFTSNKLIAVSVDSTGQLSGLKSKYENGFIVFKTRNMGDFAVSLDTIPPLSKTPLWEPDDYSGSFKLIIELESDLSGIANYKCYINEMWTVSEYNPRKNRITVYPEDIPTNTDSFQVRLELVDFCGNQGIYYYSIAMMK